MESVYKEVDLNAKEVFPRNATARVKREDRIVKQYSQVGLPPITGEGPVAPEVQRTGEYWKRKGWYFCIKDGKTIIPILVFKDTLREAVSEMKRDYPTRKICYIARHGDR